MKLLRELLMLEGLNKKFKIWFKDGEYTVRYGEDKDAILAKMSDSDKTSIDKIEELS